MKLKLSISYTYHGSRAIFKEVYELDNEKQVEAIKKRYLAKFREGDYYQLKFETEEVITFGK